MKPYINRGLSKVYFALLIVVYVATLFVINEGHQNKMKAYVNAHGLQVDQSILDIRNTYENFANFIYSSDLSDDLVVNILDKANNADPLQQQSLRSELNTLLQPLYLNTLNYNFRQLHFHLANGQSFLRFHQPDMFGDDLTIIRPTIREVISTQSYISGFEEGRQMSGYRFVFPLFKEAMYVGSVEISVPALNMISELYTTYSNIDIGIIMKREVLEKIYLQEALNNHIVSLLSSDYLIESANLTLIANSNKSIHMIDDAQFNQALYKQIQPKLNEDVSFNDILFYDGKHYMIHFNVLKDIDRSSLGFLYTISLSDELEAMPQKRNQLVFISTGVLMFMITIFYFVLKQEEHFSQYAMMDPLTQAYNRGTFNDFANKIIALQEREKNDVTLAMIDVDNFKNCNDIHGHKIGDKVLTEIVNIMTHCVRKTDILGRYGGDEFVLLLPKTDLDTAICILERVRHHVEKYSFTKVNNITLSIGVYQIKPGESLDDVINKADIALYKAKSEGRNRIEEYIPS